jgi:zinc/manganese transport system substrate-binding protein
VASFTILADMVRQVGGADVTVSSLVGPDGDVHVYSPTPGDARELARADLVVVNGLTLEGWMGRLITASQYRGPVVVASAGIRPRRMAGKGGDQVDPHAWQDLALGRRYVAAIAAGLERVDPAHAATYRANARAYEARLTALDGWVRSQIAQVPRDRRRVITTHDAFGYFGAAYGVTFLAPEGLSTEAEVGAGDLAHLIRQIRRTGIKALFLENITDPRLIRDLAGEAHTPVGGTLATDALTPPGGIAPTYIAMFRHNVPLLCAAMMRNRPVPPGTAGRRSGHP